MNNPDSRLVDRQKLSGILLILCAAMLWGTTGTAQTFSPLSLSSYWVGTARLLVSAVFFLLLLAIRDARDLSLARLRPLPWTAIVISAAGMAVYNLAFFAGIRATSVAVGTAIALGSGPVWAGILQALLTRRSPSGSWWLAVAVAVLGLTLATLGSANEVQFSTLGIGLCLLSGMSYAVYALTTKHIMSRTTPRVGTAWVFTLAAAMALPAAFVLAGTPVMEPSDVVVMLWLGVVATGIAYLLFSTGLRFVSGATGVALALAEPVTAVCLAIVIVGERPTQASFVGLGMLLLGLAMLIRLEVRSGAPGNGSSGA